MWHCIGPVGFLNISCFKQKSADWTIYLSICTITGHLTIETEILSWNLTVTCYHLTNHHIKQNKPTQPLKKSQLKCMNLVLVMFHVCTSVFFTLYFLYNLSQLWLFVLNVLYTRCIRNVYCTITKFDSLNQVCSYYFSIINMTPKYFNHSDKKNPRNFEVSGIK